MSSTRSPLPSLAMGRFTPFTGAILLALLTALWLAVAAPALAAGVLSHRTISNVATIEWDAPAGRVSQQSNRVDLSVGPSPLPLSLSVYRFASNSATISLPVSAPQCGTAGAHASGVVSGSIPSIAAGDTRTVLFRVTIN